MEKKDEELIKELVSEDAELRQYYDEHLELEKQLAVLNGRLYLSAEQEVERKQLQKRKLAGKDHIMEILARYRNTDSSASA